MENLLGFAVHLGTSSLKQCQLAQMPTWSFGQRASGTWFKKLPEIIKSIFPECIADPSMISHHLRLSKWVLPLKVYMRLVWHGQNLSAAYHRVRAVICNFIRHWVRFVTGTIHWVLEQQICPVTSRPWKGSRIVWMSSCIICHRAQFISWLGNRYKNRNKPAEINRKQLTCNKSNPCNGRGDCSFSSFDYRP